MDNDENRIGEITFGSLFGDDRQEMLDCEAFQSFRDAGYSWPGMLRYCGQVRLTLADCLKVSK